MSKPFELIFFISVMIWMGVIAVADGPSNRTEMICKPIDWFGRLAGSVASLGSSQSEIKTRRFFDNRMQDCRKVVFKQFYEATYLELLRLKNKEESEKLNKVAPVKASDAQAESPGQVENPKGKVAE